MMPHKAFEWQAFLATVVCLPMAACAPSRSELERLGLPSLKDIHLQLASTVANGPNKSRLMRVVVHRVDLPLDASIEQAWELVYDDHLQPTMIDMWQTNGMGIAVLEKSKKEIFIRALGKSVGRGQRIVMARDTTVDLRESPPLKQLLVINLMVSAEPVQVLTGRGSTWHLIARVQQDAKNHRSLVELVPYHHRVHHTIKPRTPQEKDLDGRYFDELALAVPLESNQLLAISLHRLPPLKMASLSPSTDRTSSRSIDNTNRDNASTENTDRITTNNAESSPSSDHEISPNLDKLMGPIPIENNLGQYLLTGKRSGQFVQMVLLAEVFYEPFGNENQDVKITTNYRQE